MRPFDESDLIAYYLHELSAERTQELHHALQQDAMLATEAVSIAALLAEYKHHTPSDVDAHAIDRNWDAVRHAIPRVPVLPTPFFRWRIPVLAGAGLAFAVPIFFAVRHPQVMESPQQITSTGNTTNAASPPPTSSEQKRNSTAAPSPSLTARIARMPSSAAGPLAFATPAPTQDTSQQNIQSSASTGEPIAGSPRLSAAPAPSSTPLPASQSASSSASATLALPSIVQNKRQQSHSSRHASEKDITLSIGGTFLGTRESTANGITRSEGGTHAVAAIASFHQQFRPLAGYRIVVSYTRPDFQYSKSTATNTYGQQSINGRVFELASTYVVQGPRRGGVTTYVEAGAGVMAFLPTIPDNGTDYDISPAGIVGLSADVPLTKHLGVHAAYRVQVFRGPDFHASTAIYPLANSNILVGQEPSVGITYRFTQKQR